MWPFTRRAPRISEEVQHAADDAERRLTDVDNLSLRVERAADVAAEIKRQNHIAAAVLKSIRGV